MNTTKDDLIEDWSVEDMLEVTLPDGEQESFWKVIETLTRIGFESKNERKLIQSCHILQKKGRYYIMHFKELFLLDGRKANLTLNDLQRRNTIAKMLEEWGLVKIVDSERLESDFGFTSMRQIKVIPYAQKKDYELEAKYSIGHRH